MEEELTPENFFDTIVALTGKLINSFNPNEFPFQTLEKVDAILAYKKANFSKIMFYSPEIKTDFQDVFIDLEEKLLLFKAAMNEGELAVATSRKDFVTVRNSFLITIRPLVLQIKGTTLSRFKNFQKFLKIAGLV